MENEQPVINNDQQNNKPMSELYPKPIEKAAEPLGSAKLSVAVQSSGPNNLKIDSATEISQKEIEESMNRVKDESNSGSSIVVVQWICYALWWFTSIAAAFVVTGAVGHYIDKVNLGDSIYYGITALMVLLVLSVVCDNYYSKHEPENKKGAASVVSIVHSVFFAVSCLGAFIAATFSLIDILLTSSESKTNQISLYSSLIIFVILMVIFLRAYLPHKLFEKRRALIIFLMVICTIIFGFGLFGPMARAVSTRYDRLMVVGLPDVKDAIDTYTKKHKELPAKLTDIEVKNEAATILKKELVEYKIDSNSSNSSNSDDYYSSSSSGFQYQLCVTYKEAWNGDYYSVSSSSSSEDDSYSSYLSIYSHPKGDVCYKLEYDAYSSYYDYMESSSSSSNNGSSSED